MEFSYSPVGVCSMRMTFKIKNDVIEYKHYWRLKSAYKNSK